MHKMKVVLDTTSDIIAFVDIATNIDQPVYLEDGTGFRVNAKSLMGVMYGKVEFKELYVISDSNQLTSKFLRFTV